MSEHKEGRETMMSHCFTSSTHRTPHNEQQKSPNYLNLAVTVDYGTPSGGGGGEWGGGYTGFQVTRMIEWGQK